MIISSSNVNMSSSREYSSYKRAESMTLTTSASDAPTLELSEDGKTLSEQLKDKEKEMEKRQQEQLKRNLQDMERLSKSGENKALTLGRPKTKEEEMLAVLQRMLQAMKKFSSKGKSPLSSTLNSLTARNEKIQSFAASNNMLTSGGLVNTSRGTQSLWVKTTVSSVFASEQENTAFSSTGVVKTADGRQINFQVDIEMSRSFTAKYEEFSQEEFILTDPLVINLDSNVGSVTDKKFLFDLDADGKEEEISFAGQGSGFLALDKNNDGKINDGNELFGTKSGDGFTDLSAYDEDKNGWIDEADSIFSDLKIWTKDEDGKDRLIDLKQADVGAIYLGNADTQFSLNDKVTNQTNGVIQKTGVYLKESGGVGTVQHIDLRS